MQFQYGAKCKKTNTLYDIFFVHDLRLSRKKEL